MRQQNLFKEQQAKGLLSSLGIRTPLNKIPLLGDIIIRRYDYSVGCNFII